MVAFVAQDRYDGLLMRALDLDLDLDPLVFHRYRVDVVFAEPLAVPAHRRAILWRGAFGSVFRGLVCHDEQLACEACPLRSACPFPRVFAPSIPEGRPTIARLKDPPRPFVISDPEPESAALPARTPLGLGLTIVGTAVVDLPYFVVALRRLSDLGIGVRANRFRVDAVRCLDAAGMSAGTVFERGSEIVPPRQAPMRARDLRRPGDAQATRVRVRFVTPTDIRGGASVDEGPAVAPSFGALFRRARDRAGALATFYGEGALPHDPRALAEAADRVRTVGAEVRRVEVTRRSSRTGERHPLGGVVGAAVYEGPEVAAAIPWLRLAEVLGVGKHAAFGHGRVAIEVLG